MTHLVDDHMNDKKIVGNSVSSRKSNGTPIKMLIAQEMSKEEGSKQTSPNLVARLMGLDDLPKNNQLNSVSSRSNPRGSRSHSRSLDFNERDEVSRYKDVFEIWQQSCKTYDDESPKKVRNKESKNEKKMTLVREKFMEAKRLSTDNKLRQSKQFKEALEVLSSNKDLFLKLLQEPNSLFPQHHHNLQSVPPPPDSRRITVLRPSKLMDGHKLTGSVEKNGKQINKNVHMGDCTMWDKFKGNPTHPTRIVVLKPSSEKPKTKGVNSVNSPPSSLSLRTSNEDGFYGDPEDSEAPEMIQVPAGHRRDETLISSVFSNGYIGDESSFSKSEVYYAAGNLSDSEVMSPISRHSWDYVNRFDSPYSSSSFSRASYSPESSVCMEAKKRLSERWAMMALNGNNIQEQRHVRRSSSTLGEMLALSDLKNSDESEEPCAYTSDLKTGQDHDSSPKNLARSKSVPVSSTLGEVTELLKVKKDDDSKDLTKEKSQKSSSFKGKVSNLFFSKSRKSSKQKSHKSGDEHRSEKNFGNDGSQCIDDMAVKDVGPVDTGLVGEHLPEMGFSVTKLKTPGNGVENQDQPSPNSVLDSQFEDDDFTSSYSHNEHDPKKYNLIDKSPPIGSIARTLSFEDSPLRPVTGKTSTPEEEEQACFLCVQTLLSAAGIEGGVQSSSFLTRWHSPESPLDPSLRENYMTITEKEPVSKQRHQRSFHKLVFDCVNEALISGPQKDVMLVDHVWARMKEWISGEEMCVWEGDCDDEDGGGTTRLAVERVVMKEVVGEVWAEHIRLQVDYIKMEIEEKFVEQLVEEFVLELAGGVILGYTP
ncbi:uncharacterized protein [Rutidosis leptorrhynchoides]